MIHKFAAKNFFSIKDSGADFEVNRNAPDTTGYTKDLNRRVSKIMTLIGPNASGKTNILKILPFLQYFIVASFNLKPDEEIPYEPFLFTSKKDDPTELSVLFSCKEILYEYTLKLNPIQVLSEKLRKYNIKTKQFSILFDRLWNKTKDDYYSNLTNFKIPTKVANIIKKRKNASVISIAAQIDHKLSTEIIAYWSAFESNVMMLGKHDHFELSDEAARYYFEHPEAKKLAEDLLTRFDLGLTKLQIEKHISKSESGKQKIFYTPLGFHKGEKKNYPLPFFYESHGTKCLFSLLSQITSVLLNGGIAILDEFDADLHPHMLPELIDLFTSEELNPKNAQLIFSTHHHEILNKLDKYQIILIEKNQETGITEAWRLDTLGSSVRMDDNYYSKYITGVYGGVPEL